MSLHSPENPTNPDHQGHGPLEVEIKLRPTSLADALQRIQDLGFQETHPRTFESNQLMDRPDGSLRAAGEVLRLREFGEEFVITYKGAAMASDYHKVREEIETTVGSLQAARTLLERLGFVTGFCYEKYRTIYSRTAEPGLLTLDETPIGPFLELEGDPHWIDRVAAELGYSPETYITDSYGRLWAKYCVEQGLPVSDFVFPAATPNGSLSNG